MCFGGGLGIFLWVLEVDLDFHAQFEGGPKFGATIPISLYVGRPLGIAIVTSPQWIIWAMDGCTIKWDPQVIRLDLCCGHNRCIYHRIWINNKERPSIGAVNGALVLYGLFIK